MLVAYAPPVPIAIPAQMQALVSYAQLATIFMLEYAIHPVLLLRQSKIQ